MKVCKNCGEVNVNDSLYCCNCGKSDFTVREETVCPNCGAVNDKTYEHCTNCGAPLVADSQAEGYTPVPINLKAELYGGYSTGAMSVPSEMARCPHCGALVPITAIFCHKCGVSVANLHSHRVVERKVCPHCGRLNKLESDLCTYCFGSLAGAQTEQLQVTHEAHNLGELTVRQAYLEGVNGKNIICPNCGTLNPAEEPFCVNCGLKLEIEEVKKYCPICGAENPFDSVFCSKCRHSFDGSAPDGVEKWTCPSCDHVNEKDDLFCPNCGQKKNV